MKEQLALVSSLVYSIDIGSNSEGLMRPLEKLYLLLPNQFVQHGDEIAIGTAARNHPIE